LGNQPAFEVREPMIFLYQILLLTGALGLTAMALVGFVHHGGPHGQHDAGHVGGAHSAGELAGGSHAGAAHAGGHAGHAAHHGVAQPGGHVAHHGESHDGVGMSLLSLLSPMTLFAACLGAGAVGSALTHWGVPPELTAAGAAVGAVSFNALVVRPTLRLVMGFASVPASGLAGTLMQHAEAVTAFDANGEGLVRVQIDGQSVDLLARLCEDERRQGTRVLRGQSVRVEDVDPRSNRCTVSRL
jgi:hypothetical protein